MSLRFRPLTADDQDELWNWLHMYGRALMQAALEAARKAGYKRVSLTVHPQNPAIRLYESCGFRKAQVRNTYHLMVAEMS